MDEFEQRFIVKYFHMKGGENKKIIAALESTFQGSGLSRAMVKRWLQKFQTGDLSFNDQLRRGRPLAIWDSFSRSSLGSVLSQVSK
jgi:transposase